LLPAVELTDVRLHPGLAAGLDTPTAGPRENYTIGVIGWVRADGGAPATVELRASEPEPVAEAPVTEQGRFELAVDALRLPTDFRLELSATWPDRPQVPLATLRGRRAPLPPAPGGTLQPILVNGMGRMGGTWLVRLLGEHPDAVAYRPFEVEPRVLSYWISLLLTANSPASQIQRLAAHVTGTPLWWTGNGGGPGAIEYVDGAMAAQLGRAAVEDLSGLVQRRVDAFYRAATTASPRFFVEKGTTRPPVIQLAGELFQDLKEIVLIRDPRDVFTSTLMFTADAPPTAFRRGSKSEEEFLLSVRRRALDLALHCRSRAGAVRIVRYEELVRKPLETLTALFEWLTLDARHSVASAMLATASLETPQMRAHRTSRDSEDSIGRWERDLPPPLRDRVAEVVADVLPELGYEA
jgi:Sulfotransferase family